MIPRPSEDLIARYGGRGPRYTSYPPVPVWTDAVGPDDYRQALAEARSSTAEAAIYVHLPFCAERCWYCGCNVSIQRRPAVIDTYVDQLAVEVATVSGLFGSERTIRSLHVGGGTPNHLSPEQLGRMLGTLRGACNFAPDAEFSVELAPRPAKRADVEAIVKLGFTRLSFGVQDIDPGVGKAIGRTMDGGHVASLIRAARHAGATNINIDLMYGLPLQTPASMAWMSDCVVNSMRPDRIALYGYAHVPWLRPQQRRLERNPLPGAQDRVALFATAADALLQAGYKSIGLDHFALPSDPMIAARRAGTLSRTFMGYTTTHEPDLIGLGTSAIGKIGTAAAPLFVQNAPVVKAYQRATDGIATVRGHRMSGEDRVRGGVIHDILCRLEVRSTAEMDLWAAFPDALAALRPYEDDGLIVLRRDGLDVTELGRYFLRPIAMQFDGWRTPDTSTTRYSATV